MGITRCICNTNEKPVIKTEERATRKYTSVKLSLFCFMPVIFFALAKSDIALMGSDIRLTPSGICFASSGANRTGVILR